MSPDILSQIPTSKSERWKYTNLPRVLKGMDITPATLGWAGNVKLLSPKAPGAAVYGDTQLWDLNAAQTKDIKFITSSEDVTVEARSGQSLSPRLIVHVKSGDDITLIERQTGQGAYWKNQVVQVVVEDNARLRHYRFIEEDKGGVFTGFTHITLGRDARYESMNFISGGGFIRNQIHAEMKGQGADCRLAGINLLSGEQHADTTITIEHQAPNGSSHQTYKSVLKDSAHGVFQGKVHVHQAAQKTDGYQLSNALLLSPLAHMDTKPELEIYADDVKCSHGATTGAMDEEPLFYMRSRGIPEQQARAILIESFLSQAADAVSDEGVRADIQGRTHAWLSE